MKSLAVSFELNPEERSHLESVVGSDVQVRYLPDLDSDARAQALSGASVLFARNTDRDLNDDDLGALSNLSLIQFITAGIDFIDLERLPESVPIAVNGGGYAEPMAEHALAMVLAACKRLLVEHANVARNEFNQFTPTRMLHGMTAGILGYGGIGMATGRVLKALGVRVHAINRSGRRDDQVDWMGGPGDLDTLLSDSDILVLSLPLTARTEGMIGARELGLMKPDAILVNLARGEIVDEAALYSHLQTNPEFIACIDAWWVEPVRHGEFRMDRPFTDLPNVIASPHNSASVGGWRRVALERAGENCRRQLAGEGAAHVVGADERAARR
jgi:phosphoglycerate dehydrogenase-like enzyme